MKLSPYLFSALAFFLVFKVNAQEGQSRKIDSLVKLLPSKEGIDKFEAFRDLFSLYNQLDYAKSYQVSLDALKTATELKDSLLIIRAYRMKGIALGNLAKNQEAISILLQALKMVEADSDNPKIKEQKKYILNSIATAYTDIGNYARALEYNFKSLIIRQEDSNRADESIALNNIGLVYYRMDDHQKAIDYYSKCLSIRREIKDMGDNTQLLLVNLALCHLAVNKFEKAISNINEALNKCEDNCNKEIEREAFNAYGIVYIKTDEIKKAETYFLKSLDIARMQNNIPSIASNLIYLSKIESQKQNSEKAIELLRNAENILLTTDYPTLKLKLYTALYELFQGEKKFGFASSYQDKYIQLNNMVSKDLIKNLSEVQTDYAERENIKTIKAKDQILALNTELIQRQKQQTIFIATIALLLLLLAAVFYKNYRDKLVANRKLDDRVKERTEQLRATNHQLTTLYDQQVMLTHQMAKEGQGILSTINGLCHVAMLDLQDDKAKGYLKKVEDNTGQLLAVLGRLKS